MGNSNTSNSPTRQHCGGCVQASPGCCSATDASPWRGREQERDGECRPLYTQGAGLRHPAAKKPLFFHTQSTGWQGTTCESLERKVPCSERASRNSGAKAYNTVNHNMRSPFPNLKKRKGSEHAPARYVGVTLPTSNEVYYNVSSQTKRGRRSSFQRKPQPEEQPRKVSTDTTFASHSS